MFMIANLAWGGLGIWIGSTNDGELATWTTVFGCNILVAELLQWLASNEDDDSNAWGSLSSLFSCYVVGWNIYGSTLVYSPHYEPDTSLEMFAFVSVTLTWTVFAVVLLGIILFCCVCQSKKTPTDSTIV
jgi:uncharacterized membrane protein